MLDFVNNLPTESTSLYATLKQEVYNECFENPNHVNYNYFVCITNHILTLDFQYQASCMTRTQTHPHCGKCNGLGHTIKQHIDNLNASDCTSLANNTAKPPPKNSDRGP